MLYEEISEDIFRIIIPFENIYTSVFVLCEDESCIIADCATNDSDIESYVLPSVREIGKIVKYIFCSHDHGDHSGGLLSLAEAFREAKIVTSLKYEPTLLGRYEILCLGGHSDDSIALYDSKNKILLSFDALQLQGVGRYKTYFSDYSKYKSTIAKLRAIDIEKIFASHDYVPYGYKAEGKEEIKKYLDECERIADVMESGKEI